MTWQRVEVPHEQIEEFVQSHKGRARFLIDENLGIDAARVMRDLGWNAKYVDELGLRGRSDHDVYQTAFREKRTLLTHDNDFLNDRQFPPHKDHPGVVVLPGASGDGALEKALPIVIVYFVRWADLLKGRKLQFCAGTYEFTVQHQRRRTRFRLTKNGLEEWTG